LDLVINILEVQVNYSYHNIEMNELCKMKAVMSHIPG